MLAFAFILIAITPLACMGLNRVLATRLLALGSAATLGVATLLILATRLSNNSGLVLDLPYIEFNLGRTHLLLRIGESDWGLVVVACSMAALALLNLGLALPEDVRHFGGVPAAFTFTILMVLAGILNNEPLLEPAAWMLAVLLCSITLRASGLMTGSDAPLVVLLSGSFALILLLAAQQLGGVLGTACLLMACLLLIGTAPFGAIAAAMSEAPAGLGGMLLAIGLPLLGAHSLLHAIKPDSLSHFQPIMIMLGIAMLCAGAARALNERQARLIIAWQHCAQYGLFVVAVGQGGTALIDTAPLLLLGTALTTGISSLAISLLERRAGSDNLEEAQLPTPLLLPGLAALIAGACAVGIPGTLGLWGHLWLYDDLLQAGHGWAVGLLLMGSAMLGLSYLAPLATLWRGANMQTDLLGTPRLATSLPALAGAVLLVLAGFPPVGPERLIGTTTRALLLLAGLLLAVLPLLFIRFLPSPSPTEPDEHATGATIPAAFAESVGGLAWLTAPSAGLNLVWLALLQICQMLAWLLAWFERRYYLAGLTLALIVIIFIFL